MPLGDRIFSGKRVVVVEDEGMMQLLLRRLLTLHGAIVVGATHRAPEAVEMVRAIRPDLVLMDIALPGPYDGLEAARRILQNVGTCVVVLTGYSTDALQERARQIGVCGYLIKPIGMRDILPQLEAALRHHAPADP